MLTQRVDFYGANETDMLGELLPANVRVLAALNGLPPYDGLIDALESDPELDLVARRPSLIGALDWLASERADVVLMYSADWDREWTKGIRECHRRCPGCDVVVLADRIDADNTFECIEAGAVGYLLRNADHCDVVVTGIKKLKHGGAPLDSMVARQLLQRITAPCAARDEGVRGTVVPLEAARLEKLTKRERSILALMARGDTYAEVADVLEIAVRTVETHAKNIYRKLAVHSRSEAVFEAHRAGLLETWR